MLIGWWCSTEEDDSLSPVSTNFAHRLRKVSSRLWSLKMDGLASLYREMRKVASFKRVKSSRLEMLTILQNKTKKGLSG
jgi:hypothetical protein